MNDKTPATITPELGQTTNAQITYKCSFIPDHYYVTTDLQLSGRGISQTGDGTGHSNHKKTYRVTEKAMQSLKRQYTCTYISDLD
jgi:hypothetical protein